MDIRLGLKVKFTDPANPAEVVSAQFATVRGHKEMKDLLDACYDLDARETIALRRYAVAAKELDEAETPEAVDAAGILFSDADKARREVSEKLLDAVHRFVVQGFVLAGSTPENAEQLSMLVGPEQLAELRVKCAFGAGVLDFTGAAAR